MALTELLDQLGYLDSEHFLRRKNADFEAAPFYGHLFRRAAGPQCSLQGVYSVRASASSLVPVVYVCEATDEKHAREIHRLVWNQGAVPFLIVTSPECTRVYPGYTYRQQKGRGNRGVVQALLTFKQGADLADLVHGFHADAVDSGRIWRQWGRAVNPQERVDWNLLANLKKLDERLQRRGGLAASTSHALIGKYVYLHYLKDRNILSKKKLDTWSLPFEEVFGRNATIDGLRTVIDRLDQWLNGHVFPIDFASVNAPTADQVRWVAATFSGDQPLEDGSWQLHLDFKAYDFSYIPIETLSVVYEQFLHSSTDDSGTSVGRQKGAYYTPIPVVNLMIEELEQHRPLQNGVRVLDPACGSGAFLVQCYRRLIEKELPGGTTTSSPTRLARLLQKHIFGIDNDYDACCVTELSLILTLLDYVDPPDLEPDSPGARRPPLPKLHGENIFCGDFFQDGEQWQRILADIKCDWIVGNPPWKQLSRRKLRPDETAIWRWMLANTSKRPVGSNQTARAFAWRVTEYLAENGVVALFLPAMTLFDNPARDFRKAFFEQMRVHTIINFANLAEVISAGRFRVPASAFFYTPRGSSSVVSFEAEVIRAFSPLVANQEITRPTTRQKRNETWSIVINASEIRDIPLASVLDGDGLPWKLATWGSSLDQRLLRSLERSFRTFGDLERAGKLCMSEGIQPRPDDAKDHEYCGELIGKKTIAMERIQSLRDFFVFPAEAITRNDKGYLRVRGGKRGLAVNKPPHVIVNEARSLAIYSDDYLIVPPRQIGIVSTCNDKNLLKAISLFLSSEFSLYHQFLVSSAFGVKRDVATLKALRKMPMPLIGLSQDELRPWADLHALLVEASRKRFGVDGEGPLFSEGPGAHARLLDDLNKLVYESLCLSESERALVTDMVRVRLGLIDGKLSETAVRQPTEVELAEYAKRLKTELDEFIQGELSRSHQVDVVFEAQSGMVQIDLLDDSVSTPPVTVLAADSTAAQLLRETKQRLRKQHRQWIYFDRNLRIYEGTKTFILKPMQRFHWTRTQARLDAREIIAEILSQDAES